MPTNKERTIAVGTAIGILAVGIGFSVGTFAVLVTIVRENGVEGFVAGVGLLSLILVVFGIVVAMVADAP